MELFINIMIISNTVILKGLSPNCMRQVTVLLVFSLKFTHVKMKEPNKSIQPENLALVKICNEKIYHKKLLGKNIYKFL